MAAPGAIGIPVPRRGWRAGWIAALGFGLLIVSVLGGLAGQSQQLGPEGPSPAALADIPTDYLVLYERAAVRYGIDWSVLAAIGKVECDHGRSQLRGCNPPGTVNAKGATGPMQFLGSTWRAGTPPMTVPPVGPPTTSAKQGYATDGDGDGLANVWDPADAIFAAARLLAANGAPGEYRQAIAAYNHSQVYVNEVLAQAQAYRATLGSGGVVAALGWAVAHVGRFTYNLGPPTDRGGTVAEMQRSEPAGTTCDCSMYVRWALAQASIDAGLDTATQWTANGLLPNDNAPARTPEVVRGVGSGPPSGGLPAGRHHLLRPRRRPDRPRRALPRRRRDRPVLRRHRLEHPPAGRLRHAHRLGPLEPGGLAHATHPRGVLPRERGVIRGVGPESKATSSFSLRICSVRLVCAGPVSVMTSQGSAQGRFTRAIQQRNLWAAETSLREFKHPPTLEAALAYLDLLAEQNPEKLERAAVRWHGRLEMEATMLTLAESQLALGLLASLCTGEREAVEVLRRVRPIRSKN